MLGVHERFELLEVDLAVAVGVGELHEQMVEGAKHVREFGEVSGETLKAYEAEEAREKKAEEALKKAERERAEEKSAAAAAASDDELDAAESAYFLGAAYEAGAGGLEMGVHGVG